MNLNHLQIIGLIMIIIAIFSGTFLPGTVVYYSSSNPTVTFGGVGSTTPNSPALSYCNLQTYAQAFVSGISRSEVLNASFQFSEWTGSSWTLLQTVPMTYTITLSGTDLYRGPYTLGATPGLLYAISYAFVTSDAGTFAGLAYVETANLTGYFTINGQLATQNSFIRVSSPTLTLTYTVTSTIASFAQSGQVVAYVNVMDSKGNLIQKVTLPADMQNYADTNLTATFTLPSEGSYTLNGFVTYGGQTAQQMSLLGSYGNASGATTTPLSEFYFIIGLFGAIFFILGTRQQTKAQKEK
jgi:hypothetical protein